MTKNKTQIAAFTIIAFCLVAVIGWLLIKGEQAHSADSGFRPVMSTFARIVVVADDEKTARLCIEKAFQKFTDIENTMSYYKSDSQISSVNRDAFKEPVKVSDDTFKVIKRSIEFSKLSEGAFDVTVGPLVDLWRKAGEANSLPTEQELQDVRSKVGFEKIILDANEMSIRFSVEGMRIDLGGIAKGYAVDKAIEIIRQGAKGAMVDLGGNIRCFGTPQDGKKSWLIAVQNPDLQSSKQNLFTLKLSDEAVATSGNYQRFVTIGGKRYSHILNLQSASPAEELSSVTIIAPNAADADALSTAVTVLGKEKGLTLIETLSSTASIVVTSAPDYEIIKTRNADKFIER